MSWSIYTQGTAQAVSDSLASQKAYPDNGPESQKQIERAKVLIRQELDAMICAEFAKACNAQHPADKGNPPQKVPPVFVSVKASGHHEAGGQRSMSIAVERLNMLL